MLLLIRRLYVIDNLQKGDIKLIGQENLVVQSIPKPVPAELVPRGYWLLHFQIHTTLLNAWWVFTKPECREKKDSEILKATAMVWVLVSTWVNWNVVSVFLFCFQHWQTRSQRLSIGPLHRPINTDDIKQIAWVTEESCHTILLGWEPLLINTSGSQKINGTIQFNN